MLLWVHDKELMEGDNVLPQLENFPAIAYF